ncbi:hypothetical protein BSIN_4319 [Burkholderia singularis]|uniref:Uncharacterized protein n=1 Tax=Burkholderia singularis TaxID=1503053 RepID=A0A238H7M5_9BURK|nr:hypothetical protein BSIN_4319 [Burkholderia singularis]
MLSALKSAAEIAKAACGPLFFLGRALVWRSGLPGGTGRRFTDGDMHRAATGCAGG